jgi:hypothetical protein
VINSRQKGARGERQWRDELRAEGYLKAYRGQQFSGGADSPDVVCHELPFCHFEVKFVEAGNPYKWMTQAIRDAKEKMPVVAHKRNNCEWLVILRAPDFFKLIKGENEHVRGDSIQPS